MDINQDAIYGEYKLRIIRTLLAYLLRRLESPFTAKDIMIKRIACVLQICFILFSASVSFGLVRFDFEQPYFNEPGLVVKDHCLIRIGSTYHLFYLRGNPAVDVGHATSTDLIQWNVQQPVLSAKPGTWNERALWAPEVMFNPPSEYWLYYTGVNNYFSQQTGMALSLDLYSWGEVPWPIYHPDPSWANWTDSTWSNGRDPFIFEHDGIIYQLVTASTNNNKGAIASATSTDFTNWIDQGPIYIHDSWHAIESVQCIYLNSKFHLFFTEETVGGTSHMCSDSLYNGWDISDRRIIDLGLAPEIDYIDGKYIFSRHGVYYHGDGSRMYTIRFDELIWGNNQPFVTNYWGLRHSWNYVEGTAFIWQPTFENNPSARGDSVNVGFVGNCWIGSYEKFQGPLTAFPQGHAQGDAPTGIIRSNPFVITGNSMNLLVGGGNYPDLCYVAMVKASTGEILFTETGENTDEMTRRYWNLIPHKLETVYIEIADKSSDVFGHICVDNIIESTNIIDAGHTEQGTGRARESVGGTSGIDRQTADIQLYQNSPNPFNPHTTISYYIPSRAHVSLHVYDVRGALIRTLVNKEESDGNHRVLWDGRNGNGTCVSAGIYFYRLTVGGRSADTKKMVLLK
jgi:hypothetical protein